jgi:hypothetical protein
VRKLREKETTRHNKKVERINKKKHDGRGPK